MVFTSIFISVELLIYYLMITLNWVDIQFKEMYNTINN